ncbi:Abi family protein [Leuconostoc mesenteroides]|nr:Abi family protein [Leuconostoc mesenteroides]
MWYSRSKKSTNFISGTKIEYLEELVQLDSFIKGKLLEVIRSFENMFLGSFAYHFEMEYKNVFDKMSSKMQQKTGNHNVGTQMTGNIIQLIPM